METENKNQNPNPAGWVPGELTASVRARTWQIYYTDSVQVIKYRDLLAWQSTSSVVVLKEPNASKYRLRLKIFMPDMSRTELVILRPMNINTRYMVRL
jgi:hypothetical protein